MIATLNRVISHANAIAVLLFVFWIYLAALLFLLGGEIAKAVEEHRQGKFMSEICNLPVPHFTPQSPPAIKARTHPKVLFISHPEDLFR